MYVGDIYAQGEREGWSDEDVEGAVERCFDRRFKELQGFHAAVVEVEEREEQLFGAVRRDEGEGEERRALEEISGDEGEGEQGEVSEGEELGWDADIDDDSSESESEDRLIWPGAHCGFRIREGTGLVDFAEGS